MRSFLELDLKLDDVCECLGGDAFLLLLFLPVKNIRWILNDRRRNNYQKRDEKLNPEFCFLGRRIEFRSHLGPKSVGSIFLFSYVWSEMESKHMIKSYIFFYKDLQLTFQRCYLYQVLINC